MPDLSSSSAVASRVAVIGLGSMGLGMASSLLRGGFAVAGCDLSADALAKLEQAGGHVAASPAEAAAGADAIVCVVVNAAQTEAVLFGETGAVSAMKPGAVVIASATMDPDVARGLARRVEQAGVSISTPR